LSPLTRKPAFWIAYVAVAAAAVAVALKLFPVAIPLVNLDVRMSRAEALAAGEALNARLKLAPSESRSAVQFNHDGAAQNYVELEAGGRAAFAELTRGGVYSPYWWDVRLFAPGLIEEAVVRFKPDGAPAGFVRRVAETYVRDPATKALDAAQNQELKDLIKKAAPVIQKHLDRAEQIQQQLGDQRRSRRRNAPSHTDPHQRSCWITMQLPSGSVNVTASRRQ